MGACGCEKPGTGSAPVVAAANSEAERVYAVMPWLRPESAGKSPAPGARAPNVGEISGADSAEARRSLLSARFPLGGACTFRLLPGGGVTPV